MKIKYNALCIFTLFLIITAGCVKDLTSPEDLKIPFWQPVIAVPLASGSFSVADILDTIPEAVSIDINEEGLISLNYSGSLYSLKPNEILVIPNQSFDETHSIPLSDQTALIAGESINVEETISFPVVIPMDNNGDEIRLDKLYFKSGTLFYYVGVSEHLSGSATLIISELRNQQDEIFQADISFTSGINTVELDLSNYTLDLTESGSDNEISIGVSAVINASENFSTGNAELFYGSSMDNIEFKRIEGYFGNLTLSSDRDSLELNFFENISGYINLVDPKITIEVINTFGLSAEIEFEDFESYSPSTGQTVELTGEGFQNPFTVNEATDVNVPATVFMEINAGNSNLNALLNTTPKTIYGKINGTSNPENNTSMVNFIDEESELNINFDLDIPMWGRAEVVFADTFDLALSDIENVEEIDSASVRFIFDNGFPIDMVAQLYFLDSLGQVIDSLFTNSNGRLLESGLINSDDEVIAPVKTLFDVPLTNERLEIFTSVNRIILKSSVSTNGVDEDEDVKFFDHYRLDFKLAVKVFPKINLNDDI